jgi:hypothetical protein
LIECYDLDYTPNKGTAAPKKSKQLKIAKIANPNKGKIKIN